MRRGLVLTGPSGMSRPLRSILKARRVENYFELETYFETLGFILRYENDSTKNTDPRIDR